MLLEVRAKLVELSIEKENLEKELKEKQERSAELAERFETAEKGKNLEELRAVKDELKPLDSELEELRKKLDQNKEAVEKYEKLISEFNENQQRAKESEKKEIEAKEKETEERNVNMVKRSGVLETKEERKYNVTEVQENRAFLEKFTEIIKRGSIANFDITVPTYFVNRITEQVGDYSKLYNEVNVVKIDGAIRVVLSAGALKAVWLEKCAALTEMDGLKFDKVELDAYKLGGYVSLCRYVAETKDLVNVADLVEREIAKAIGKGLDEAIIKGTGSTAKQPEGVVTALTSKAELKADATDLIGLFAAFGLLGTGDNELEIGEALAVMNRKTFYKHILPATFLSTAAGGLVVASEKGYVLPNGARVVFSKHVDDDQVIIGDFKNGYVLGERRGVEISKSEHAQFIQDNIVFKGVALYDGKVVRPEYFAIVTMKEKPAPTTSPRRA